MYQSLNTIELIIPSCLLKNKTILMVLKTFTPQGSTEQSGIKQRGT